MKQVIDSKTRKKYQKPVLQSYGDIKEITRGMGGGSGDGASNMMPVEF